MSDIKFESLNDDELINYCKENNISYLNKQKKQYARKNLLSNINNKISNNLIANKIDIDAKLNNIIKACHDKLYKAGISGTNALNDIMNIFILVLLEYVFKSNPQKLEELIKIHNLKSKLNKNEIEEYKTYLLDINKFISKFDEKCDFSSIWRNYILFLAYLFPSLYDKDDTKFNCKEERIVTDVFKTIASLSNDINDEFINELAIKHGNIYEYFIGYCGKSENSKAFGQFFTPKPFINAILNDCGFKDMINNLEITNPTLYDPAMGSCGLLGLTYITCKDKINPNDIYGCEIEKNTMRYGESSILITTKIFNNNLIRCNTLDRLKNPYLRDNKKFDIIISNPPFGTKTNYKDLIPDEEIHNKKYKDDIYPIQTNGEKIFIQNIIYLLADGGICALILPDGELMTKNDTNKLVRKFIIDNCKIIKIVDVDNGVFKHTNIKTKVLILKKEKTENYNYEIDYLNINKKYEVKLIQKFKLNKDYHLSIKTNYEDLIINNKDIEIKTLDEVCEFCQKSKRLASYGKSEGIYPFITSSQEITKYCDIPEYKNDNYIIIGTGGNPNIYYQHNFSCSADCIVLKSTKYMYYYLLNNINILEEGFKGLAIKHISKEYIKNIKIPIPSIEKQNEIIKEIENIDILINLRKDANENLKKEKEYLKKMINKKIKNSNIEIKTLGDVCINITSGKFNSKDCNKEGKYPFYTSKAKNPSGFSDNYCFDYKEYLILIKDGGSGENIYGEHIGLGKVFKAINKTAATSHQLALVPNDNINYNYLYYYLNSIKNNIMDMAHYTTGLGCIKKSDIEQIQIYIPSLEIQEQFIKDIEELNIKFDKLKLDNDYIINNLEEYKKELFKF